jgi:zinc/manganese transport system ATP-binding protein
MTGGGSAGRRKGTAVEPLAAHHSVIKLDGVSVWLGGREILHDVSFAVGSAELTALIGPNGAGKTTILRVMLGMQPVSSGRVLLGDARTGSRSKADRSIGYVPQKVLVDPDVPLRARDLVALGLDGQKFGFSLPSAQREHAVDAMLAAVNAEQFAQTRVGRLSGGELQRVLIAHALISQPRLLLLDEPLANLDIRSEEEVVKLLARIAREQQVAVLISAHEMTPLLPVMDRVVYVAGGRAASGSTDEIIRSDVLSELYGHPVTVFHVNGRVVVVAGEAPLPAADFGAYVQSSSSALV